MMDIEQALDMAEIAELKKEIEKLKTENEKLKLLLWVVADKIKKEDEK